VLQFCITLELSVRLTFSCPKIHRLVDGICNFWFCLGHANLESRFSLKNAETSEPQERKNKRVSRMQKEARRDPYETQTTFFRVRNANPASGFEQHRKYRRFDRAAEG
jgi:hypothetical protein